MNVFQAVILGAGPPFRGQNAASLHRLGAADRVLDWHIAAFHSVSAALTFVGGYRFAAITDQYPQLRYVFNPLWQKTGSASSLLLANPVSEIPCFVCYGDIVFRNELLQMMTLAPPDHLVICMDEQTREAPRSTPREKIVRKGTSIRFVYDTETHAPLFTGLILLPPRALAELAAMPSERREQLQRSHLGEVCAYLHERGIPLTLQDSTGLWASMDDENTLARFIFGTKAETMERLQHCLPAGLVPTQVRFSAYDWRQSPETVMGRIFACLARRPLAVRSSALGEDSFTESMAGHFTSILNVASETEALREAVSEVIASYGTWNDGNQVLVQNMLEESILSGVAFSRGLEGRSPYYVINYAEGADTASVTGGKAEQRCLMVFREHNTLPPEAPELLAPLLPLLERLEKLTGCCGLDVEFAVSASGCLSVLQVRPMTVDFACTPEHENLLRIELNSVRDVLPELDVAAPRVLGKQTVWGVMPDWNPAEMIGLKPSRLASSLYQYLITDDVWATQRAEFGYRDVRPQPLMRLFAGQPFIDVRASLNSFIPAATDDVVAERIVEAGLARLKEEPELHDKLEFFLVPTCLDFGFNTWREHLTRRGGLSEAQYGALRAAYGAITAAAPVHCTAAENQLHVLKKREEAVSATAMPRADKAIRLLEDCRRYGTLPFAHLARCGFVAASLLRSMTDKYFSLERVEQLRQSVVTVSHELQRDVHAVRLGKLDSQELFRKYGHLRPGTYEITSPSYRENPEQYFGPLLRHEAEYSAAEPFICTQAEQAALGKAAQSIGWSDNADVLLGFIRRAIAGREYAKFLFTRNLSFALDVIADIGREAGLSREEAAHLDIADIRNMRTHPGKMSLRILADTARRNQQNAEFRQWVALPPLLTQGRDVLAFVYPHTVANFVTSHTVTAPGKEIVSVQEKDIDGKIVLIPQADPGYDWLFGHNPAGLVTMFGGANSHMTIRAAEHNLPAAIGVGEVRYRTLCRASLITLDCRGKRILPVE